MKTTILLFKPYTMLEGAGNKIWFFKIIPELKKMGYSFIIVDTDIGPKNIALSEINNFCKKYEVEYITLQTYKKLHLLKPESFYKLLHLAKRADIIYYVTAEASFDPYFFLISLRYKVIGGWHAPLFFDSPLHNLYQKFFKPFFCKFFVANHVVSPSQEKILYKYGLKNVTFIPHGVQTDKFKPAKNKWDSKKLNILFVGRFELQKGFDILVGGIKIFLKTNLDKNISIHLVGGGSLKKLARFSDKRVRVEGFLKDPSGEFAKSQVFIMPSRQEPWGHVVLEAMASECLVIASQTEGPKYIIGNSKAGWFLEDIRVKSIAKALESAYATYQKRRRYLKHITLMARERVIQKYNFSSHIKTLDLYFQKIL